MQDIIEVQDPDPEGGLTLVFKDDIRLKIKIVDGLVWTSLPRFPLRFFMVLKKNYHIGDINLFWKDIKENSELRTQNWLSK